MRDEYRVGIAMSETLKMERSFAAPPDMVFRVWTGREAFADWFPPENCSIELARYDCRTGGGYDALMNAEDGTHFRVHGVFRLVEPPRKIIMTWIFHENEIEFEPTRVTIDFLAEGDSTRVRVTQEFIPGMEFYQVHEHGWGTAFERIAKLVADRVNRQEVRRDRDPIRE